ncbi:MAG: four helix bundle suffix domain-containing protein [Akkermansiaceae bacterium]
MKKIRPSGGYRHTASFQTATIIYDATYWFCEAFIDPRSRTTDQMVQAARSGRQNIAEGSRASATSSQTELRLVNVARASLEELLLDYEDYLRHRRLPQWDMESPEAQAIRVVPGQFKKDQTNQSNATDLTDLTDAQRWELYSPWLDHKDPAIRANALICLIHQANYLLDRQIASLEAAFIDEGGYSEQLATARLQKRKQDQSDQSDQSDQQKSKPPLCPTCSSLMSLRTAKTGKNAGQSFWGCTNYPNCKGTVKL